MKVYIVSCGEDGECGRIVAVRSDPREAVRVKAAHEESPSDYRARGSRRFDWCDIGEREVDDPADDPRTLTSS